MRYSNSKNIGILGGEGGGAREVGEGGGEEGEEEEGEHFGGCDGGRGGGWMEGRGVFSCLYVCTHVYIYVNV